MNDYRAISAITSIETVKLNRASRRGKLTRLTKRLEEITALPLQEQSARKLNKLKEDFSKEKKLHEALQFHCEQLLETLEGTIPEQLAKTLENSEETNEVYEDTLH